MVNPLLFPDIIYDNTQRSKDLNKYIKIVHNLMDSVIKERQEYLKQEENMEEIVKRKQRCLLDTLLTATIEQRPLSLKEIRDEVNTFIFAVCKKNTVS